MRPGPSDALEVRHLAVPRTARYAVLGSADAPELWFALHGYGQLAEDFARDVAALASPERRVVVPEGLSRFYLSQRERRIGASWMTSSDRAHEIADYVRYLDALRAAVEAERGAPPARTGILGFSQGAATGFRWAALGARPVDALVLWGGGVPPDVDVAAHRARLAAATLHLVVGSEDPYVDDAAVAREERRLESAGLAVRTRRFAGGHRLDDALLRELTTA